MGVPGNIGDVQPFAELGRGAITFVYKAYQQALGRVVLLKVLRPSFSHVEEIVERFEEEARLIAQIQHPNVVTIYRYGREDDRSYFIAEYVEGMDLAALLSDYGALPLGLATYILEEAAKGLAAAHRQSILHRDIKPGNIMIGYDGQVKLTDFGLASIVPQEDVPGEVRGTPGYMAPEQLAEGTSAAASDFFALGATFYETITGERAFPGTDINESIDAVLNRDPLSALAFIRQVPGELKEILGGLLVKDPGERWDDAEALIRAVERFRSNHGLSAGATDLAAYLGDPGAYRPEVLPDVGEPGGADSTTLERSPGQRVSELLARSRRLISRIPRPYKLGVIMVSMAVVAAGGYLVSTEHERSGTGGESVQGRTVVLPDTIARIEWSPAYGVAPTGPLSDRLREATDENGPETAASAVGIGGVPSAGNAGERSARGYVTIAADSGAAVYIGRDSVGETPLAESLAVDVGRHRLTVRHPRFPEYRDSIDIAPDEKTTVDISLESLMGRLDIRVSPWAEVSINGEVRDTIPPRGRPFLLTPGSHLVSLKHPELGVKDTLVWVTAGDLQRIEFSFQPPSE
jgi:serine/threonine-protein kinase